MQRDNSGVGTSKDQGDEYERNTYKTLITTILSATIVLAATMLILIIILIIPIAYKFNPLSLFAFRNEMDFPLVTGFLLSVVLLVVSIIFLEKNVRILAREFTKLRQVGQPINQNPKVADEEIMKFLDDGERRIYELLVDSGGSVLQRDLVGFEGMSRPTVSRIVDRLEKKGIVEKVRHGSTNNVILKRVSR